MQHQKSLVLITVDCLRADHTGFMGYERPTTPFLDQLAGESFVVPSAMVAGAPTYYSLPAIQASRYPLALGRDVLGLAPGEPTLASVLQQAGYATAAFSASNPYISARFGYEQGFEIFQDFLGEELVPLSNGSDASPSATESRFTQLNRNLARWSHSIRPLGRVYDNLYFEYCQRWAAPPPESLDSLRRFPSADVIVDHAIDWIASAAPRPFFLWLHLMDPHAPYYPKEAALEVMGNPKISPWEARYSNSYWNRSDLSAGKLRSHCSDIVALYDAGVRWVDMQVARLVNNLQEAGLWDQSVFALTADHGEEFLEHEGRFHSPSRTGEEVLHVPLLLRVPGAPKRNVNVAPFSLLHLAPTLLDTLGVAAPADFQGTTHWPQLSSAASWDEPAIAESVGECTNPFRRENRLGSRVLVVRDSLMKLVVHLATGASELYNLNADPGETSPLPPDTEKPIRRKLLEYAKAHVQASLANRRTDARLRARLYDLKLELEMSGSGALG
jgi:arylsulfatase A-like enzyme